MTIVERIRHEKLMTQQELADAAHVTKGMISLIENGQRGLSISTAKKLAPVLGVAWHELIPEQ